MCTLSAQPWNLSARIALDYTVISSTKEEILAPCPIKLLLAMPRPLSFSQRAPIIDLEEPQCVDRTGLPLEICQHFDAEAPQPSCDLQSRDPEQVSIENRNVTSTSNENDDDAECVDPLLNCLNDDSEAFTEFIEILHTVTTTRARSSSPVNNDLISSIPAVSPPSSPNAGSSGFAPSLLALNAETEFIASNSTLGSSPVSRSVNPLPRDRSFAPKKTPVTYQRSRRGSLESPMPVHPFPVLESSSSKLRQVRTDDFPEPFMCLRTFPNCTVPVPSRSRSLSGENFIFNRRRWNVRCDPVRSTLS